MEGHMDNKLHIHNARILWFNPSGGECGIFQAKSNNATSLCVAMSSAAMLLTVQDRLDLVFTGKHYGDVTMSAVASQMTGVSIVLLNRLLRRCSKKHQSSTSLAFVMGIDGLPVDSPHKGPITLTRLPFDEPIAAESNIHQSKCR